MQYIYLIRCQNFYKIGVANDVQSRLAQLSTGNPFPLELMAAFGFENANAIEAVFHQKFASRWQRGEWFSLNPPEIETFTQICQMLDGKEEDIVTSKIDEFELEEAEAIDNSLENVRTELRMSNGHPRGVVLVERGKDRNMVAYIGQENDEFEKYLEIYKQEHPNSKIWGSATE